jgi:hypothetical protein
MNEKNSHPFFQFYGAILFYSNSWINTHGQCFAMFQQLHWTFKGWALGLKEPKLFPWESKYPW